MNEKTEFVVEIPPPPKKCPRCLQDFIHLEHPMRPGVIMSSRCACTNERQLKWDRRFLDVARLFSTWSKDPSTRIGCVIVGPNLEIRSTGYNGFARGVADDDRLHDRDQKYPHIVHAEENAILNATLIGTTLKGCTSYAGWTPCTRCARMLIQVGIAEVIFDDREIPERWQADFKTAQRMLAEAGVRFRGVPDAG